VPRYGATEWTEEELLVAYAIAFTFDPLHPIWEIRRLACESFDSKEAVDRARDAVLKGVYDPSKSTGSRSKHLWEMYLAKEQQGERRLLAIELLIAFGPKEDSRVLSAVRLDGPPPFVGEGSCRTIDLDAVVRSAKCESEPGTGLPWLKRVAGSLKRVLGGR
jgi:hypothetical protein